MYTQFSTFTFQVFNIRIKLNLCLFQQENILETIITQLLKKLLVKYI